MSPRRHPRAAALFDAAVSLDGDARAAYLAEACDGDERLRADVEELLSHDVGSVVFLGEADVAEGRRRLEALAGDELDALRRIPDVDVIGPFRVLGVLGEGGMGLVYEAEQDVPRRRVALKVMRPHLATPARLARFRQEVELLGRLSHPGIAQVYASGSADLGRGEQPYFALELVEGRDLAAFVAERRLPSRERVRLLIQLCDALQHAHERGVVHRDLKPDNVLVDDTGRVKILDFGVARAIDDSAVLSTMVTDAGDLLGTIAYMAPEQVDGRSDHVTPRTDVYAVGVIGYQLLAGRLPHDVVGLPLGAAMRLVRDEEPARLGALRAELSGDLETIVAKAMEKEPDRRYASTAALRDDLASYLAHRPIVARPPSVFDRARRFTRRHRALVGGFATTVIALSIGLLVALDFAGREARQRERAEHSEHLAQYSRRRVTAQVMGAIDERRRSGDAFGAASLLASVDEDLRGWAWQLHARALPRLLANERRTTMWFDDRHVVVDEPGLGPSLLDVWSRRLTRPLGSDEITVEHPRSHGAQVLAWTLYDACEYRMRDLLGLPASAPRQWRVDARTGPDGRVLMAGCVEEDGGCALFVDDELVWRAAPTGSVRITPDATRVLVWTPEDELHVLDAVTGQPVGPPVRDIAHTSMRRIAIASDSRSAVVLSSKHSVFTRVDLADASSSRLPDSIVGGTVFAISPDQGTIAVAGVGEVRLYDLATGKPTRAIPTPYGPTDAPSLAWSPDGSQLAIGADRRGALLVDLTEPADLRTRTGLDDDPRVTTFSGHESWVYHLAVSPDGRLAASLAPSERVVRTWDVDTGEPLAEFERAPATYYGKSHDTLLAFTPDGRSLLATTRMPGAEDLRLVTWDLVSGESTSESAGFGDQDHRRWIETVAERFGEAGGRLGRTAQKLPGGPVLWVTGEARGAAGSSALEQRLFPHNLYYRGAVATSPDGSRVALVGPRSVAIHDVASMDELARHMVAPYAAAYSPDGAVLAVGDVEGRVHLYDAEYDVEFGTFRAADDYVFSVAWSPAGDRLVTASGDGTVRVWDARPRREREADLRARRDRLDALRELDDAALRRRLDGLTDIDEVGALVRVLLERR